MSKIEIWSIALYPQEGSAIARRRQTNWQSGVGDPWPTLTTGDEITVHDQQGWTWQAIVEEVLSYTDPLDEAVRLQIVGDKQPQPMPDLGPEGGIRLPNMSGHAHARFWAKGDVVHFGDGYFKVKAQHNLQGGSQIGYTLTPSTAEQYTTRPGRMKMSSREEALAVLGSALQTQAGEWLHAKKMTFSTFSGALGRSKTYWVKGRYVTPLKAAKLNEVHPVLLSRALGGHGTRVSTSMPQEAVVLLPKRTDSLAATGERLAVLGGVVLHERHGDPDMIDSWYPYVVQIEDEVLAARTRRFVKAASKKKPTASR